MNRTPQRQGVLSGTALALKIEVGDGGRRGGEAARPSSCGGERWIPGGATYLWVGRGAGGGHLPVRKSGKEAGRSHEKEPL